MYHKKYALRGFALALLAALLLSLTLLPAAGLDLAGRPDAGASGRDLLTTVFAAVQEDITLSNSARFSAGSEFRQESLPLYDLSSSSVSSLILQGTLLLTALLWCCFLVRLHRCIPSLRKKDGKKRGALSF